jgi:transposase
MVSSERSLEGKMFTTFVVLILVSHLNKKMKETKLYGKYTMSQLLDKLVSCIVDI